MENFFSSSEALFSLDISSYSSDSISAKCFIDCYWFMENPYMLKVPGCAFLLFNNYCYIQIIWMDIN